MTEGGDVTSVKDRDVTSLKDGSDADLGIQCTPCGEDNINVKAVKYCLECQEYLCTVCTRHHGRPKATRSHKLLDIDSVKRGAMVAKTTKCHYHPDRDIEMYCGTHDMVYCVMCIATTHRECFGVSDKKDTKSVSIQQDEIENLQNDTEYLQERLTGIEKDTQENIRANAEQKDVVIHKIKDVGLSLTEHIQILINKAINTLNKTDTEVTDELTSYINKIANLKKELEKTKQKLQTISCMDVGQQFMEMKLIQNSVREGMKLCEEILANGCKSVSFTENIELKTSITTAKSLGHIRIETENKSKTAPRQYQVKSKKEINVKTKKDRDTCFITDVCQIEDGTIILADWNNQKIKRLDTKYNVKDHLNLDARPSGMCCTGQNEIAVKMNNKNIQFISVDRSLSKLRTISVECVGDLGLANCAGELWQSTGSHVNVYSTSGTLLKTFKKDIAGRDIFKSYPQHMAVRAETVFVTDGSDGAVCLDRLGTVERRLRTSRLINTKGVCMSRDGTVFLSGYDSDNIVMFDKDGKCLGNLVSKDRCLVKPVSLLYDEKSNCMIATCFATNKIMVFVFWD